MGIQRFLSRTLGVRNGPRDDRRFDSSLGGHLAEVLDRLRINCILDVGANAGQYGRLLRTIGYRGRIHSFEPVGRSYDRLVATCAGDQPWRHHRLALGAVEGHGEIGIRGSSMVASFLIPTAFAEATFGRAAQIVEREVVPVRRLDQLFDELVREVEEPRVLLKMDTRSSDLAVLRGAEGCLNRVVALQTELPVVQLYDGAPSYVDALAECRRRGFEVTGFFPIFRNEWTRVAAEFECVMVRASLGNEATRVELELDASPAAHGAPLSTSTSTGEPSISVLVATAGSSPELLPCLARLREQARANAAELVVVINAPRASFSEAVLDGLRGHCDRLAFEETAGKSSALNTGVRLCRGEVIAFTDDDTVPQAGWLEAITAPLLAVDRPPSLVGIGGPVRPVYESAVPRWYRDLVDPKGTSFLGPKHDLGSQPIDYLPPTRDNRMAPLGSNCAYRREIFRRYAYRPELGPNTETGLRGGEDFELAFRLLLDGHRLVYRPEAVVHHPVSEPRMTLDYVARGFYVQGIEHVRMLRVLGMQEQSATEIRAKVRRREARQRVRRWFGSVRYRRGEMKLQFLRGMLAELEATLTEQGAGLSHAVHAGRPGLEAIPKRQEAGDRRKQCPTEASGTMRY